MNTEGISPWITGGVAALEAAASGAAAGSVVPGFGTAVGGLLGLASSLAPHIFGETARPALAAAAAVITGAPTEAIQLRTLTTDEQALSAFKLQALQIAADEQAAQRQTMLDELTARLTDTQSARQQTAQLVASGSKMAWGAPVVSIILLLAWFGSMIANYYGAPALGSDDSATLRNLALLVGGYWLGSSAGSARKDERQANMIPAHLVKEPLVTPKGNDA